MSHPLANAANWRTKVIGGHRCIVDDDGTIAIVFSDNRFTAKEILLAVKNRAAVAQLARSKNEQMAIKIYEKFKGAKGTIEAFDPSEVAELAEVMLSTVIYLGAYIEKLEAACGNGGES